MTKTATSQSSKTASTSAFGFLPAECVIQDEAIIREKYQRNVTALSRSIPLVLKPVNTDQVAEIVGEANKQGVTLYPISTGKNWGMGSKLPVVDNCVILDLSLLNKIVEVNEELAYAVLEPGVTQGQLARYLEEHHPSLSFNLTGTFGETSIMGNTLERGDGCHARIDDLMAVRGVLGNGTPFEVGGHWGAGGADQSHVMRYTAGPDMVGLFSQSNFAVVTQLVFKLEPRADKRNLFWGITENARLNELITCLRKLYAQRIITPAMTNVGYANRFEQARATLGDKTADTSLTGEFWNFYIAFDGSDKLSQVIREELETHLAPCCKETGYYARGDDPAVLPPHLKPIVRPMSGHPDYESIKLVYKLTGVTPPTDPFDLNVDQTAFGMKSHVAVVPPTGEHIRKVADMIAQIRARYGLNIKPSFFGDGRFLNTIHFVSADPAQVAAAEKADMDIWNALEQAGYVPYRVAINQMENLVESKPEFFALVSKLKQAFDPNDVISPGRYCPNTASK